MAKNILICDDSPLVHKSMTRLLKDSYDINLYYAENGSDGLDKIAKNNIDVVFLDLTMPIMDGFEVLKRLPTLVYKPTIVIISADVQKEAARRCLMLGADYFLSKPFEKKKLQKLLSDLHITELTNTTANENVLSVDYIEDKALSFFKNGTPTANCNTITLINAFVFYYGSFVDKVIYCEPRSILILMIAGNSGDPTPLLLYSSHKKLEDAKFYK